MISRCEASPDQYQLHTFELQVHEMDELIVYQRGRRGGKGGVEVIKYNFKILRQFLGSGFPSVI